MFLPQEYFVFTGIFVLGLISPGPDFALITRNSLIYSRSTGRWSAVGIATGILIHVTYCILGIGFIIQKSMVVFSMMKLAGAAYLIYLGCKALWINRSNGQDLLLPESVRQEDISPREAFRMGFVTNALNPKVTILFIGLFTQVLGPHTPVGIKMLYGSEMFLFTLIWFLIIATAISAIANAKGMKLFQTYAQKVTGVALIAFGARLAFARSH